MQTEHSKAATRTFPVVSHSNLLDIKLGNPVLNSFNNFYLFLPKA